MLKKIVFEAQVDANRRIAAESLIAIDPNGADAKQIIRTALIGGKGLNPFPTLREGGGTIRHNRKWAYEQLRSSRIESDWAIGILIKICEVEIDAGTGTYDEYYIIETASLAVDLGYEDPRVLAHLKKYANTVFPESSNANKLHIHYDSLIKEIVKLNKDGD